MAIQDTFIGNLRAARGIASGMAKQGYAPQDGFIGNLRKATTTAASNAPKNIDTPSNVTPRTYEKDASARQGTLYLETPKIADNSTFRATKIAALPKTEEAWQNFIKGIDGFKTVLNDYSKEKNQDKRIEILERNAPKFMNSEKLSRYLYIMREDELANKNGKYKDFDYTQVKPGIEQAIEEMMSLRIKKA